MSKEEQETSLGVSVPRLPTAQAVCTRAAYRFQRRHVQIFEFCFFFVELATRADQTLFIAAKALAKVDESHAVSFQEIQRNPDPAFQKLASFSGYQSELMVIRLVDNFSSFLSEVLQKCMLKRPDLLRSNEQIKTEDVLRFSNRRDLVDFIINRKLNSLAYGGVRGIEEFLKNRLGIDLLDDVDGRMKLSIAIELRNIYTHNRGVVNELFLSRLTGWEHDHDFVEGKRYHAELCDIVSIANTLFDIAVKLDEKVLEKFRIKGKRFSTWDKPRLDRLRAESDKE